MRDENRVANAFGFGVANSKQQRVENCTQTIARHTMMKKATRSSDQHKIPQVYLRKFGYRDKNNQWKVSVLEVGTNFTQQKSIESFLKEKDIFDLKESEFIPKNMIDELNSKVDNIYNKIISYITEHGALSEQARNYFLQFIVTLLYRNDFCREWVRGFLNHKNGANFIKIIMTPYTKNYEDFENLERSPLFKYILFSKNEDAVNYALLLYAHYVIRVIADFEINIFQAPSDILWMTSDNPVSIEYCSLKKFELLSKDCEIYFPISPKYFAYLYSRKSDIQNRLKDYSPNVIHSVSLDESEFLQDKVLQNPLQYLIFPEEVEVPRNVLLPVGRLTNNPCCSEFATPNPTTEGLQPATPAIPTASP